MVAPREDGDLEDVLLIAFASHEKRASYYADQRLNRLSFDFLSEKEIACAIGARNRTELWDRFDLREPEVIDDFLREGQLVMHGKVDPQAKAPE